MFCFSAGLSHLKTWCTVLERWWELALLCWQAGMGVVGSWHLLRDKYFGRFFHNCTLPKIKKNTNYHVFIFPHYKYIAKPISLTIQGLFSSKCGCVENNLVSFVLVWICIDGLAPDCCDSRLVLMHWKYCIILGRELRPSKVSPTDALSENMPSRYWNMFNLHLCNAATIRYSRSKFGHMHLCGMDYTYVSPHCCKCNSFGCTAAIRCGSACHGSHNDSIYSGSKHSQFDSPRLVKRRQCFHMHFL